MVTDRGGVHTVHMYPVARTRPLFTSVYEFISSGYNKSMCCRVLCVVFSRKLILNVFSFYLGVFYFL